MNLSKAMQLPVKDKDNLIRFFIGGLLDILPVVNLLSSGYAFLLMRHHILEEPIEDLPEWNNWGTLFKYGFLWFLGTLGYALIPFIIFGLGMAALYPHVGILTFIGITLIVFAGICFIAALLLFPMGMILFAIEDEFSVLFSFFKITDLVIKHIGEYLKAFLVILLMGIVLSLLSYIPVIGWILGTFVGFYLLLEIALLMGDIGREIVGADTEEKVTMPESTATATSEPDTAAASSPAEAPEVESPDKPAGSDEEKKE
jgi:hypothetical protein